MVVGRMGLLILPYFATEIQEWERAISRKRARIVAENRGVLLLMSYNDSSLVIDKLCDEAVEGDPIVVCFYFDFAARNEQSPVNMLGSLLRQLVNGQEEIPETCSPLPPIDIFSFLKSLVIASGISFSPLTNCLSREPSIFTGDCSFRAAKSK